MKGDISMCARRYTKTQHLLPVIEEMIAAGKTHKEIERELELEGDRPVHNLLKRERKKELKGIRKQRGRSLCLSLGLKTTLLCLLLFARPIGVAVDHSPSACFFFLINCH